MCATANQLRPSDNTNSEKSLSSLSCVKMVLRRVKLTASPAVTARQIANQSHSRAANSVEACRIPEERFQIAPERTPALDPVRGFARQPRDNHLCLRKYGASRHTFGECGRVEIQSAACIQYVGCARPTENECDIAVGNVDQRMMSITDCLLHVVEEFRWVLLIGNQKPLIRTEPHRHLVGARKPVDWLLKIKSSYWRFPANKFWIDP